MHFNSVRKEPIKNAKDKSSPFRSDLAFQFLKTPRSSVKAVHQIQKNEELEVKMDLQTNVAKVEIIVSSLVPN